MANTIQGRAISPNVAPVIIDDRLFEKTTDKAQVIEPENVSDQEDVIPKKEEQEEKEEDGSDEIDSVDNEQPVDWINTSAIVAGINVLLIVLGFLGFKFMKKRSVKEQEKLLSRLD